MRRLHLSAAVTTRRLALVLVRHDEQQIRLPRLAREHIRPGGHRPCCTWHEISSRDHWTRVHRAQAYVIAWPNHETPRFLSRGSCVGIVVAGAECWRTAAAEHSVRLRRPASRAVGRL